MIVSFSIFQFLERFLAYLYQWKAGIEARLGFSKAEKDRMFLSQQTFEGIVTTGKQTQLSFQDYPSIFCTNVLLTNDVPDFTPAQTSW